MESYNIAFYSFFYCFRLKQEISRGRTRGRWIDLVSSTSTYYTLTDILYGLIIINTY